MKALATNQTIAWFYQRFKENNLKLSPDFQRNPVWQKPQKDYLIETILLDLPIPEIYVVNRISKDGDSEWIVVDGQQRLRTVLEFVSGELEVDLDNESLKHIKRFSDLKNDDEKTRVWRYPIVIRDLEDSNDDDVRSLFQRLNKYSFALNEQELRNARFKGHFLKAVEEISENDLWTSSGLFSANDFRRMKDLEYAGILLSSIIGGIFHRTERLDEFYIMYEKEFEQRQFYIDLFVETLELIQTILPDIKKTVWRNKANFFTLFLVLNDLESKYKELDNLTNIRTKLEEFENKVTLARNEPEKQSKDIVNYLDAMTYGTNDKERRLTRYTALKKFLES